ncbi:MAG: hypothetical protein R2874_10810 [Desulfobacterales bacterium]
MNLPWGRRKTPASRYEENPQDRSPGAGQFSGGICYRVAADMSQIAGVGYHSGSIHNPLPIAGWWASNPPTAGVGSGLVALASSLD